MQLAAATNVRDILATLDRADAPDMVVIDSIQTMYIDTLDSRARHGRAGARLAPAS